MGRDHGGLGHSNLGKSRGLGPMAGCRSGHRWVGHRPWRDGAGWSGYGKGWVGHLGALLWDM